MKKLVMLHLCAAAALAVSGCKVEQTREGEMPEVKVEGGQVPKYDVKAADVDVGTTTETITVPDVDVNTEKKEIQVPDVNVKMPQ